MIGVEFYRRKARMTRQELADKAGIPLSCVGSLENNLRRTSRFDLYLAVSDALGVPVDALLGDYDEALLLPGDHRVAKSNNHDKPAANCIAEYRRVENLSLDQLGRLLGVTRQMAHKLCKRTQPQDKAVNLLAAHEGISTEVFQIRYAPEEVAA
jgi:transcriptional regulator with XRE-family HTH domain